MPFWITCMKRMYIIPKFAAGRLNRLALVLQLNCCSIMSCDACRYRLYLHPMQPYCYHPSIWIIKNMLHFVTQWSKQEICLMKSNQNAKRLCDGCLFWKKLICRLHKCSLRDSAVLSFQNDFLITILNPLLEYWRKYCCGLSLRLYKY